MMPEMNGHEFIRQVRSDPTAAHLPVIILTASKDQNEKIAGFEAGTDDYLVKPVDPTELDLRVKALLARARRSAHFQPEAKVITLFSLRGGVGTTSLAVNLSAALAQIWGIEIPLLDLSLKNGHCALMLNAQPKNTIARLAGWDTPTLEAEAVERLLSKHATGIKLLPAPQSPIEAELITTEVLDRVWPYLRASHPLMVVDGGSQLIEPALTALERSHAILLMLAPELASVKAAVDALRVFEQLGYERERVMPVVNWIFPHNGLSRKSIETALDRPISAEIPNDTRAFVQAINSGQPSFVTDPTSQSSVAIAALAYKLSSAEMESKGISDPSKLLTWARKMAKAA